MNESEFACLSLRLLDFCGIFQRRGFPVGAAEIFLQSLCVARKFFRRFSSPVCILAGTWAIWMVWS
jgi:hypothetical protein